MQGQSPYGEPPLKTAKSDRCRHPRRMQERFLQDGVECMILGCTELPLAFAQIDTQITTIDPTTVLAEAAISYTGYQVK